MSSGKFEFPECYIYGSLLLHLLLSVTFRLAQGEAWNTWLCFIPVRNSVYFKYSLEWEQNSGWIFRAPPAHGDTQGQSPSSQGGQAVSLWPCTCSWLQLHKGKKKRIVRVFMHQIKKESLRVGVKSQHCASSEVFSNLSHSVTTFGNWKWKEIVQITFRCLF